MSISHKAQNGGIYINAELKGSNRLPDKKTSHNFR